ncbi:MAG: flippase [[Pasteurella] aerogenes]|nr:flippase [[Pasteurella] aerogenes]
MVNVRSVKFNFLMNLILTSSNFLFPLIIFPYISRVLLPEGTGKVAFATSIITYFTIIAGFGVSNYGVRAIAQIRENREQLTKTTQEILSINILCMILAYVMLFMGLYFVQELNKEFILLSIMSLSIFFSIIGVEWFYKGVEQYKYITVRSLFFKLISLGLVFLFVNDQEDYTVFGAITIFSIIASGILNFLNLRKFLFLRVYDAYDFKRHIRPMFILFLSGFAIAIYTNIDATLLGFLVNNEEVGYYNAAIKIKGVLLTFVTSLGIVLLPRLSYYIHNGMDNEFRMMLNKSMNFIFLISIPISVFFIVFADAVILILAGENYLASIFPLKIVMLTIIFIGVTNILGVQVMLPLGKDFQFLLSVLVGAIVNISLNLFLIPKYLSVGTSIATTIAEFIVLLVQCLFLRAYFVILFKNISYIKILLSVFVSIYISMVFNDLIHVDFLLWRVCIVGVVFGLFYFLSLFVLRERFVVEAFGFVKNKLNR